MYIQDIDLKLKDWAFAQRKGLPYDLKLLLSERRIRDWYSYWQGDVYVSFSGGLDSTILLHMVRKFCPDVEAVFCDTGLEYPELKQFVRKFDNVTILRPEISFREVIKKYGYPLISKETAAKIRKLRHGNLSERYRNYLLNGDERGKLGKLAEKWKFLLDAPFDTSEKCCDVMKKKPFKKFHKEGAPDLYPEELRDEIDAFNEILFHEVNNGVYKAGFSKTQEKYEEAYDALFARLDILEERLSTQRYLFGNKITDARCSILKCSGRDLTSLITRHISLRPSNVAFGLRQLSHNPQLSLG